MNIRIIGGKHKGKKLFSIHSNLLRPSSSYLKETLFNIILHHYKEYLIEKNFLDVFAGTGAIAFEALSRGANTITLVEKESLHCKLIKKNLINIPFTIINKDFFLTNSNMFKYKYALVYLDPPYNLHFLPNTLIHLLKLNILDTSAVIITESKKNTFNKLITTNTTCFNKFNLHLEIVKTIGIKELHFFKTNH